MLKDKLADLKSAAAEKIPADTLAVMLRCRKQLEASGIFEKTIAAGAILPDFRLQGADGSVVDLVELRRNGPVVISLYRGVW